MSNVPRELTVDLADDVDRAKLESELSSQLASGAGTLRLTDRKGKLVIVATANIAYVEIGTAENERRIGFGG
jgi:hypothetical protein